MTWPGLQHVGQACSIYNHTIHEVHIGILVGPSHKYYTEYDI